MSRNESLYQNNATVDSGTLKIIPIVHLLDSVLVGDYMPSQSYSLSGKKNKTGKDT